jgi:nucleotidyltransferase substrate binding protein (TIGR01987 family)
MIDFEKFRMSLEHLELQNSNRKKLAESQPPLIREAVDESVIQRFETCYDALWKVLKRYLVEILGLPDVPNSPKPLFRLANENGVLPSNIKQWLKYADARIATSHDYSGQKAQQCLALVDAFILDSMELNKTMSKTDQT